jgi:hypothetical protein
VGRDPRYSLNGSGRFSQSSKCADRRTLSNECLVRSWYSLAAAGSQFVARVYQTGEPEGAQPANACRKAFFERPSISAREYARRSGRNWRPRRSRGQPCPERP